MAAASPWSAPQLPDHRQVPVFTKNGVFVVFVTFVIVVVVVVVVAVAFAVENNGKTTINNDDSKNIIMQTPG